MKKFVRFIKKVLTFVYVVGTLSLPGFLFDSDRALVWILPIIGFWLLLFLARFIPLCDWLLAIYFYPIKVVFFNYFILSSRLTVEPIARPPLPPALEPVFLRVNWWARNHGFISLGHYYIAERNQTDGAVNSLWISPEQSSRITLFYNVSANQASAVFIGTRFHEERSLLTTTSSGAFVFPSSPDVFIEAFDDTAPILFPPRPDGAIPAGVPAARANIPDMDLLWARHDAGRRYLIEQEGFVWEPWNFAKLERHCGGENPKQRVRELIERSSFEESAELTALVNAVLAENLNENSFRHRPFWFLASPFWELWRPKYYGNRPIEQLFREGKVKR